MKMNKIKRVSMLRSILVFLVMLIFFYGCGTKLPEKYKFPKDAKVGVTVESCRAELGNEATFTMRDYTRNLTEERSKELHIFPIMSVIIDGPSYLKLLKVINELQSAVKKCKFRKL